jgi:hypothetical protein
MIDIVYADCGEADHFLSCPIVPVSRSKFLEIENKLWDSQSRLFLQDEAATLPGVQISVDENI